MKAHVRKYKRWKELAFKRIALWNKKPKQELSPKESREFHRLNNRLLATSKGVE